MKSKSTSRDLQATMSRREKKRQIEAVREEMDNATNYDDLSLIHISEPTRPY